MNVRYRCVLFMLFLCVGTHAVMADTEDPLTVEVDSTEWTGGIDVNFDVEKDPVEVNSLQEECKEELLDVYDCSGRLVRSKITLSDAMRVLPEGVYIIGGRKYWIKK